MRDSELKSLVSKAIARSPDALKLMFEMVVNGRDIKIKVVKRKYSVEKIKWCAETAAENA